MLAEKHNGQVPVVLLILLGTSVTLTGEKVQSLVIRQLTILREVSPDLLSANAERPTFLSGFFLMTSSAALPPFRTQVHQSYLRKTSRGFTFSATAFTRRVTPKRIVLSMISW
jgi:hypothetical protein